MPLFREKYWPGRQKWWAGRSRHRLRGTVDETPNARRAWQPSEPSLGTETLHGKLRCRTSAARLERRDGLCLPDPDAAIDDLTAQAILSDEFTIQPPAADGTTTIADIRYSFLNGYEPADADPANQGYPPA